MENCKFCNISKDKIIIENENALAQFSKYPFRKGHCIVISKRHITSISELSPAEAYDMSDLTSIISRTLENVLNAEKTYMICIGDQINHLHYHLIPKLEEQKSMGNYCFTEMIKAEGKFQYQDGEYESILKKINNKIQK